MMQTILIERLIVKVKTSVRLLLFSGCLLPCVNKEGGREGGEGRDDCYTYYSDGTIYTDQQ